MTNMPRWKIILVLVVCLWGVAYSAPNVIGADGRAFLQTLPGWLPQKTVNLGLDLRGGSHLLLEVETEAAIRQRADDIATSARPELRSAKIAYTRISALPDGVRLQVNEGADIDAIRKILRKLDEGIEVVVSEDKRMVEAKFTDAALKTMKDQVIGQSIEIVRRRVDETGTAEPVIQRQGEDRIILQLPGVEDPEDVKKKLGQTAKLSFHLVDTGTNRGAGTTMTLPLAETPSQTLPVMRKAMLTGDMLTNAQPAVDSQSGQPIISFRLNSIGAKRFCDVSRENVNKPFAIVLDRKILSAPNIREPICGGMAQISGSFTLQEASDLSLLLRAGALPAPLHVLEERSVGPSLGADSVEAGKIASLYGLGFILLFMALTYSLFGIFAGMALMINVGLVFALLSALQATLTLPGIAGIVLTVGMAVDANVLVFERIREEIRQGRSIRSAIDMGYSKAMSTIVDANLTTLIAAIILYSFGTGPIKGFAVTLAIGIMTSMFSAIMVTRLMVLSWVGKFKPKELPV